MSNNYNLSKKRKANNDGRATTDADGAHDHEVNTGKTNDSGSFLSSWFGYYFPGRNASGALSGPPNDEESIQQSLSQMNKIMRRMEEKLTTVGSTVSSLERRCEQLERKCSSLENNILESSKEHIDEKFDSLHLDLDRKCNSLADRLEATVDSALGQETDKALKRHEYNEMLIKNQRWEYSVPVLSMNELIYNGFTEVEDEAAYVVNTAKLLKDITTDMRRGEFSLAINNMKGFILRMNSDEPPFNHAVNEVLLPHWKKFANALTQFTPAIKLLPESFFELNGVQLNHDAMHLIKEALVGKPFQDLSFINNNNGNGARGGMSVDAILDIVESNKHLRKLCIERNQIGPQHIERLCSAVRMYPLVKLNLTRSFGPGIGNEMLVSLLTIDDLKLEELDMSHNNITSSVSTLLADFLATNPTLENLYLADNHLNDSDFELIANALRTNTTLRDLATDDGPGSEAFERALYDESSLNSAADSNHFCYYWNYDEHNFHKQWQINRGRKVYSLLTSRHGSLSNVDDFGDIDIKILPNMLEAVEKYHHAAREYAREYAREHDIEFYQDQYSRLHTMESLSIVYEIMRKWDKAFHLYKALGKSVN